jgi:hypothetical protein
MNGHADKIESLAAQLRSSPSPQVVLNIADALEGIAAQLKAASAPAQIAADTFSGPATPSTKK